MNIPRSISKLHDKHSMDETAIWPKYYDHTKMVREQEHMQQDITFLICHSTERLKTSVFKVNKTILI